MTTHSGIGRMLVRGVLYGGLVCAVTLAITVARAKPVPGAAVPAVDDALPSSYMPSGKVMYKEYCAACHGADARGDGPLAVSLKTRPADLTSLAKRHGGKFPADYVAGVLQFGPGSNSHGSSDMPTWGPIFGYYEKHNEKAVQARIKNLSGYLASLQE